MAEEITDPITGDDTVSLVAVTADGYAHITGTNIAAVLGIDQGQDLDPEKGRPAVKVVATVNLTLSGEQTIAGAACVSGDRVLLTAQDDAEENRPYVVDASTWTPAGDSLVSGAWWYATAGDNPGLWQLTTADPITPGTTELAIVLRATGNVAAHASSHASGGSDALTLAESQVTGLTAALAGKSATSHNHDSAYAAASHNHDSAYAAASHNHSGTYEPLLVEYSVYAASDSSSTAAGAYVVVPFSHESRAASGFSVSSGEVTIPSAGTYRVEYDILGEYTTASTKGRCPFNLESNVSGDWASVAHALAELCHGGSSSTTLYQRPMCHGWGYVTTTGANQKIRVYGGPVQNAGSPLTLKAYACRLRVTKVG